MLRIFAFFVFIALGSSPTFAQSRPLAPAFAKAMRKTPDLSLLVNVKDTDITIFDIDNTIVNMPTKLRLFKVGTESFADISSAEYAKLAWPAAAGSKYEGYEIRKPNANTKDNSFEFFGPATVPGENHFKSDLHIIFNGENPNVFQAPAMNAHFYRLQNKTARLTYDLSARSHTVDEFIEGYDTEIRAYVLKRDGYDITLPPRENFYGVGYAANVPLEKGKKVIEIARKGVANGNGAVWFFDDDIRNVKAVAQAARAKENADLVKKIKIHSIHITAKEALAESKNPGHLRFRKELTAQTDIGCFRILKK